jgi:hypothetical protein
VIRRISVVGLGLIVVGTIGFAAGGSQAVAHADTATIPYHQPALMYTIGQTAAINGDTTAVRPSINPPPVLACLPVTPPSPVPGCVPPAPPAGEPWPVNMAYFGGHVQVTPKIYLIFYG